MRDEDTNKVINDYFNREIVITERAGKSLAGSYRIKEEDSVPLVGEEGVLEALLQTSPGITSAFISSGINPSLLFHKNIYEDETEIPGCVDAATLDDIFFGADNSYYWNGDRTGLRTVYDKIKNKGVLTDDDLIGAFLENAYRGPIEFREQITRGALEEYSNCIGRKLLSCGFVRFDDVHEEVDTQYVGYLAKSIAAEKLIKIKESIDLIPTVDPSHMDMQYAIWLDSRNHLRIRPFGAGTVFHCAEEIERSGQSYVLREGVLQPDKSHIFRSDTINLLEDMINTKNCSEAAFQKFFELNPEFLAGISYNKVHPQLIMHNDEGNDYIPDFFMEPMSSRFCDLLELKLPYSDMVRRIRGHKRIRFKDFIDDAIAQLVEYRRYFDDAKNRNAFHVKHGLNAYYPKMILVVGRSHHFKSDVERRELNQLLVKDLTIWTYDDLVERAKLFRSVHDR